MTKTGADFILVILKEGMQPWEWRIGFREEAKQR